MEIQPEGGPLVLTHGHHQPGGKENHHDEDAYIGCHEIGCDVDDSG